MSAISGRTQRRRRRGAAASPNADDPRVVRSRAAVLEAARTLFLREGYAGTTVEDIASLAGITKRTVYNNYAGKEALFTQIVTDVIAFAEEFASGLHADFPEGITAEQLPSRLHQLGRRLALGIVRPEVVALRRLLIGEARAFPALASEYFDRAPRQVIDALASRFGHLRRAGLLRVAKPRRAAAQFAYLVAGETLDRAMLTGRTPPKGEVVACARDGVETFLAGHAGGPSARDGKR